MSNIPPRAGTLLIPSGPQHDVNRLHLHIVCTNPCRHNTVILVSVSSIVDGVYYDPTCVLQVGDHIFIKRQSYVYYRLSRTVHVNHLALRITLGEIKVSANLDARVHSRVCTGLIKSKQTPRDVKNHYVKFP